MTQRAARPPSDTGPLGPVLVSGLALLLVLAPLLRGGNRTVALVVLEPLAAALLAGLAIHLAARLPGWKVDLRSACLAIVVFSPLWLAAVYLVPLWPVEGWSALAGRAFYSDLARSGGVSLEGPLALSLLPDATAFSLLAGVPVLAMFLAGLVASRRNLRWIVWAVLASALVQLVLALLQAAGGTQSVMFFGVPRATRPIGTFANPNHLANYFALAFALYVWQAKAVQGEHRRRHRQALVLWIGGALFFVLGIVMTLSRGAAISGLPMALIAACLVAVNGRRFQWKTAAAGAALVLAGGIALVGLNTVVSRASIGDLSSSAEDRAILARSSLEAAREFWPWGSGWGTYEPIYRRFQPHDLANNVPHAHQDYIQLLLEGGIFFVLIAAAVAFLLLQRAALLIRSAMRNRRLSRDELLSAVAGCGLLGFLLHSLVDFSMRIPANAILAALVAGMYLRPLASEDAKP